MRLCLSLTSHYSILHLTGSASFTDDPFCKCFSRSFFRLQMQSFFLPPPSPHPPVNAFVSRAAWKNPAPFSFVFCSTRAIGFMFSFFREKDKFPSLPASLACSETRRARSFACGETKRSGRQFNSRLVAESAPAEWGGDGE